MTEDSGSWGNAGADVKKETKSERKKQKERKSRPITFAATHLRTGCPPPVLWRDRKEEESEDVRGVPLLLSLSSSALCLTDSLETRRGLPGSSGEQAEKKRLTKE